MGYILQPTAVDLDKVNKAIGSKNKKLLNTLIEEFEDEFDQYDELIAEYMEDEDLLEDEDLEDDEDEGRQAPTMRDIFTQMIMGEEYNQRLGFAYAYGLEFLCRHYGEWLSNRHWSAMPSSAAWTKTVDEGLTHKSRSKVANLRRLSGPIRRCE